MIQAPGLAFGDNGNIHGPTELFIVMSEELSNPALGIVPTRAEHYNKMGRVITLSFLPDSLIFAGSTDPAQPGEGLFTVHSMIRRYLLEIVAASRLRPLARRRLITFAPALVRIRLRKPCVRLRQILLG